MKYSIFVLGILIAGSVWADGGATASRFLELGIKVSKLEERISRLEAGLGNSSNSPSTWSCSAECATQSWGMPRVAVVIGDGPRASDAFQEMSNKCERLSNARDLKEHLNPYVLIGTRLNVPTQNYNGERIFVNRGYVATILNSCVRN